MATYMPGRYKERTKPFLARTYRNGRTICLGYFRTRAEAEQAEADADADRNR